MTAQDILDGHIASHGPYCVYVKGHKLHFAISKACYCTVKLYNELPWAHQHLAYRSGRVNQKWPELQGEPTAANVTKLLNRLERRIHRYETWKKLTKSASEALDKEQEESLDFEFCIPYYE